MAALAACAWLFAAFAIALLLAQAAIAYANWRGLLDRPGHRRSHRVPTPRGGGIGIVVALLVCAPLVLADIWPTGLIVSWMACLALVACVGWLDDHRSLPVLPRLAVQVLAVGWFSAVMLSGSASWWWLLLLVPAGVWSINLHNFMDGIDGLLAMQALFVAAGLAVLAWSRGAPGLALAMAVLACAALGFWILNRPPARIFMGDVGSGSVGWAIFAFTAMAWRIDPALIWPALVLSSVFVVDAGLTLLSRMLHGRRWYAAHREHVYQWLVRRGATHGQVGVGYLAWNLVVAAPLAWLAAIHPSSGIAPTMGAYVLAGLAWLLLKRRLVHRSPRKVRHAAA
ncbi:MAG TPA: glycosyltransferase family 4 protein [Rhodanobacter sp.]|jgi:UDP-N-acetylmuramyl pentapeptide phosphotransferase/UDP-N-acetylglucosamine-1-phosphate transferase|nr:glycosyltransferase family 4 protein [Rhodanobacter sp.]